MYICMGEILSSVIVLIIDKNSIFIFKGEGKPPVSVDADRPMIGKFTG